jgi:hypothetical protein
MADLFDMRIGGAGWHLTSHLIAIVALFVACFAITGYITFRDDSVPITALNDSGNAEHDMTVNDITATGTLAVTGDTTLGGSNLKINSVTGFTTTDFKSQVAGAVSSFMTQQGKTNATGTAIKIPLGAFILQAKVTVIIPCAGALTYDIGLSATQIGGSVDILGGIPAANLDAVTDIVFGANSRDAVGTLAQTVDSFVTVGSFGAPMTDGELRIDILYAL